MNRMNEESAKTFCEAIKKLASKEENLCNLESYLTNHFSEWLKKFASTPEDISSELRLFAEMKL